MKTRNILIVDDHKIIRDGIRSMLDEVENYKVVGEASNGKEAIGILSDLKVHLIIMDINMPEMNGVEATSFITENYPDINVLALTMHDEELYLTKMMQAGAAGYILKDLGKEELLKAIEAISCGKKYFSQEITLSVIKELMSPDKKTDLAKSHLTSREIEVLKLIIKEHSNQEIAEILSISVRTVDAHRRNLLEKTESRNTAGLVIFALKNELIKDHSNR